MALPPAQMLLSFASWCAVLYSRIAVGEPRLFPALLLLCSSQQRVCAGSSCSRSGLVLPRKAAAALDVRSVVWCFCFEGGRVRRIASL